MAERVTFTPIRVLDDNANPVSGAQAYFYKSGTLTLATVYSDSALANEHPNPLGSDGEGVFPSVFYDDALGDLKVIATDSLGAVLNGYPIDPVRITSSATTAGNITFAPITDNSSSNVQAAILNNTVMAAKSRDRLGSQWQAPVTTGTGNAYALAAPSAITAYENSQSFMFRADRDSTGAITLNIDGLGAQAVNVYDYAGTLVDLAAGEIKANGIYRVYYDGTRFIFQSSRAGTDLRGPVEKSTSAENVAGVGPDVFPDVDGVVEIAKEQAKAWGFTSDELTIAGGTTLTVTHALGAAPSRFAYRLRCKVAEYNWAVGDEIHIAADIDDVGTDLRGPITYVESGSTTEFKIIQVGGFVIADKTSYARVGITPASWRLIVSASI